MIIKLTQNQEAIIDDQYYDIVSKYKWNADFDKKLGKFYAKTTIRIDGKRVGLRMHRFITDAKIGEVVDHINGDTLDNRTTNLRKCSVKDNAKNRSLNKNSSSGYKGVVWHSQAGKWQSRLCVNKKRISLGLFTKKIDAALAYNQSALHHYGEFARINTLT